MYESVVTYQIHIFGKTCNFAQERYNGNYWAYDCLDQSNVEFHHCNYLWHTRGDI